MSWVQLAVSWSHKENVARCLIIQKTNRLAYLVVSEFQKQEEKHARFLEIQAWSLHGAANAANNRSKPQDDARSQGVITDLL